MSGVNKAIIIGNLGANPELRNLPSGQAVCDLRVATNEQWTDKNGTKNEKVEWHRVSVFGKTAENCAKYLSKGRQVYVEGRLQTREWQDKDNNRRWTTEIVANTVQFLGGKGEGGGSYDAPADRDTGTGDSGTGSQSGNDSDIPF